MKRGCSQFLSNLANKIFIYIFFSYIAHKPMHYHISLKGFSFSTTTQVLRCEERVKYKTAQTGKEEEPQTR